MKQAAGRAGQARASLPDDGAPDAPAGGPRLRVFGRTVTLPRSMALRIGIGVLLVLCGLLGFLPILGFWMVPLGLLVLSMDIPTVRRWRRRFTVWLLRRYPKLTPYLSG